MTHLGMKRRALLGAALAAATLTTAGQAQRGAVPLPVPPPPPGVGQEVVVNCCKCIGEEGKPVGINTGATPWTVSSAVSPIWQPVNQWIANPGLTGATNPSPQVAPGNVGTNPLPNVWTNTLAPASWLQPSPGATLGSYANGHYTYKLKIRVPNCAIKQRVFISGSIAADDVAKVYVDGVGGGAVALSPAAPHPFAGFSTAAVKNFNHPLGNPSHTPPGVYTIRVEVDNLGGGPTGIVVRGVAKGQCDKRLEKGKEERD